MKIKIKPNVHVAAGKKPLKKVAPETSHSLLDDRGGGKFRLQTQLTDTKYPQVWYDLTASGEVLTFDTIHDADVAQMKLRDVMKNTTFRVAEITEFLPF